jgi:hypothetical protein
MSAQRITAFRRKSYGMFIDLEEGGKVGVNPSSGEILFDEGPGEGALDGAVLPTDDFREFVLEQTTQGSWIIRVVSENDWQHDIGLASDFEEAARWAAEATLAIGGDRLTILKKPRSQAEGRKAAVGSSVIGKVPQFAGIRVHSTLPPRYAAQKMGQPMAKRSRA